MTNNKRIRFIVILIGIYSALIPLENIWAASFGGSITKYIGLGIMGILCLYVCRVNNLKLYIGPTTILLIWSLYALISRLWAPFPQSNSYVSILINMIVFTILLIQYPVTKREMSFIKFAIVIVGVILSLIILSGNQMVDINNISGGRVTLTIGGLVADNNNLAASLCVPIICSFAFAYSKDVTFKQKILFYFFFAIMVFALLMTGSRGGLLALVAGVSVFLLKANGGIKIRTVLLGAFLVVVLSFVLQNYLSSALSSRFTLQSVIESGGTGRIDIWKRALIIFSSSNVFQMLFGYGFGSFPDVLSRYSGWYVASHNDFIGVLLDLGILGLVLFLLLWRKMISHCYHGERYTELGILVAMLVSSMSMEMTIKKMFWLAIYLAFVNIVDCEKKEI